MDLSDEAWHLRLSQLRNDDLISNENLLGSPFDGYAAAERRATLIKEALAGRAFRIVIYLRPQLWWLQSVYLQGVQQGSLATPEEFLDRCLGSPWLRWSVLLDLLSATGAKAVVPRAYADGRNVVADFMDLAGLGSPTRSQAALQVNASITPAQAVILREFNRRNESADHERLRAAFQGRLGNSGRAKQSAFSEDRQSDVLRAFEVDWETLTAQVGRLDSEESLHFHVLGSTWLDQSAPYAGADLSAPAVQEAMLDALDSLMREPSSTSRSTLRRFAGAFWRRLVT